MWVRHEARFSRMAFLLLVVLTDICHSFIFLLAGIGTKSSGRNVDFQELGTNFFLLLPWMFRHSAFKPHIFWHSKCFWEEGGDVWDSQGFVLGLAIPIESIWWLRRSAGSRWKETWVSSVDGERNFPGSHIKGPSGHFLQEFCLNFPRPLS